MKIFQSVVLIIIAAVLSITRSAYAFDEKVGVMKQWETHFSYSSFTQLTVADKTIFALSNGALCSINTEDEEVQSYSKLTGLHNADICRIGYNPATRSLLVVYKDGGMDIMREDSIFYISDFASKNMNQSKLVNDIYMDGTMAYLSLPFGIMKVNVAKHEIADTYFIGENSGDVNVLQVTILEDSIFAISAEAVYAARLSDKLWDYSKWHHSGGYNKGEIQHVVAHNNTLLLLQDAHLYKREQDSRWLPSSDTCSYKRIKVDNGHFYAITPQGKVKEDFSDELNLNTSAEDIVYDGKSYWVCNYGDVLYRLSQHEVTGTYRVDGPAVNAPYRMHVANNRLYVLQGGRWADCYFRAPYVMVYDEPFWQNIYPWHIAGAAKTNSPHHDLMNVAVDPFDPEHFFVTSYGTGLYEFRNMALYRHYCATNSPLTCPTGGTIMDYTRLDAAFFDNEGNLWLINSKSSTGNYLHIIRPADIASDKDSYNWFNRPFMESPSSLVGVDIGIPQEIVVDKFDARYKWIPQARAPAGLALFFDNGTPFDVSDDYTFSRESFIDEDNNTISFGGVFSVVQDLDGVIWLGSDKGIIKINSKEDFVNSRCEKVKIRRNDGTILADYLLDNVQVNAIAIDGNNRKWIGTATSGVYLMSEDGQTTIEHFTKENSPLPTNDILSLAINPNSGRVFIGTALGLLSYQSDASAGVSTLKSSNVYAYPNPVRADYEGYITIKGLMEDTEVNITDSYGNVVCKTMSNGGIAIWDGKDGRGKRVASGVYTAFCNTKSGSNHALCKILIIH